MRTNSVPSSVDLTIPSGGTISAPVDIGQGTVAIGLITPPGLTSTVVNLHASPLGADSCIAIDGGDLTDAVPDRYYLISPDAVSGLQWFRVETGGAEAAARTFRLIILRRG